MQKAQRAQGEGRGPVDGRDEQDAEEVSAVVRALRELVPETREIPEVLQSKRERENGYPQAPANVHDDSLGRRERPGHRGHGRRIAVMPARPEMVKLVDGFPGEEWREAEKGRHVAGRVVEPGMR